MSNSPLISPFPWHVLPTVDRAQNRTWGELSRWWRGNVDAVALDRAFGELLLGEVSLQLLRQGRSAAHLAPGLYGPIHFEAPGGAWTFDLLAEPALIQWALRRVLRQGSEALAFSSAANPSLTGAFAAIVVEGFRRAGARAPVFFSSARETSHDLTATPDATPTATPNATPTATPNATPTATPNATPCAHAATPLAPSLHLQAAVRIDERTYAMNLRATPGLDLAHHPPVPSPDAQVLEKLGALPLELALVVAQSQAPRAVVEALHVGAAWMPGDGWLLDPTQGGRAFLVSPLAESAVAVLLAPDGRLTFGSEEQRLPWDIEMTEKPVTDSVKNDSSSGPSTNTSTTDISSQVLDVPVVVRVELGMVTLSAREWAQLAPGDVIETGQRLGSSAVLRVAGQSVATGELVNVEGELGVRILTLETPR